MDYAHKVKSPDNLSRDFALKQATEIKSYWFERGHECEVKVLVEVVDGEPIYVIRSNMVNGLPCRRCDGRAEVLTSNGMDACPDCSKRAEAEFQQLILEAH